MVKATLTLLSEDEIRSISEASFKVLENTGIKLPSHKVLDTLRNSGVRVDYDTNRAFIPPELVHEALNLAPKAIKYSARNPEQDIILDGQKAYAKTDGFDIPFIRDWETAERRASSNKDLAMWTKLADYLHNVHFVWVTLAANDIRPNIRSLTQLVTVLSNTTKHVEYEAHDSREAQYMIQIATAIAGGEQELRERPLLSAVQCPISPLTFEPGSIEAAIEFGRAGIPVVYMDMPLVTETSPATLAGTLVIITAENLAALVISQCANPGAPTVFSTCPCLVDPSSGALVSSTLSNLLGSCSAQIAHYYDLPCEIGAYISSKVLDTQAGYEMALCLEQILLSGADVICALGGLEFDYCVSPEKLVIDHEILSQALKYARGLEVNEDTLAVEVIEKVGPGGHFLAERHTLKHYRELTLTGLANQDNFDNWHKKGAKTMEQVAKSKVKEILASHKVAALPVNIFEEVSRVLRQAETELKEG